MLPIHPPALRRTIIIAALLASDSSLAQTIGNATPLPKGVTQVASVEGITEYHLPNGLKVLLLPDASKPTVAVNITYLVGSRHENYGETGMAHLLEHMVFKGTPKIQKLDEEFSKRGFRSNGSTTLDRTNYYELFQAGDDNLKWALEMEADRMVNAFVAKKDLDTEMTVVRNEFEKGENSPFNVLYKRLQSVAFDWHNYGKSTIGNRSDIEHVKIDNLQAFYRRYYQPDNAVLMVAGKFDTAKTLDWIAKTFGAIPKPSRTLPELWTVEPTQDGERSFVVRRKGDVQFVAVAYKSPSALHRDNEYLTYAINILATSPNSRLHKQLVESGKAVQVFPIGLSSFAPGLQGIAAVVKKGEPIEPVRDALVAAMEEFDKTVPSKDEMDRGQRDNLNQVEKMLSNHESVGIEMSEFIAMGDWRLLFQNRDRTPDITAEKVASAAKRYFRRDNRTIGSFIPEDNPQRAEIPPAPPLAEAMAGFKPKTDVGNAENFDPSPDNIIQRTVKSKIGGLDVAMLSKKTRGETVSVVLDLHWGDEKALAGQRWVGALTRAMLTHGTDQFTRAQLSDEMDKLKMTGSIWAFDTTRANLAGALALQAHILKQSNFPENELAQVRKRYLTNIEAQRNEPQSMASDAMNLYHLRYPKGDIRAAETIEERIAAINAVTLEQVKAYHQRFISASHGELALVGDFDEQAAAQQISAAYAKWQNDTPYTRLGFTHFELPPLHKIINTPDKENGVYMSLTHFAMRDDDADYPALYLANYIFGDSGMDSRVMQRIRQKDGLSYGGSSSLDVDPFEHTAIFGITAIAAPQNLRKVETALQEEIARVLKDGFGNDEITRAKSGLLQRRAQSRASDPGLAGGLNTYQYRGRSYAWSKALDEKIAQLNAEQVSKAFKKAIDPAKISVVIAGDEAKMSVTGSGKK
jgi:zinc protease